MLLLCLIMVAAPREGEEYKNSKSEGFL